MQTTIIEELMFNETVSHRQYFCPCFEIVEEITKYSIFPLKIPNSGDQEVDFNTCIDTFFAQREVRADCPRCNLRSQPCLEVTKFRFPPSYLAFTIANKKIDYPYNYTNSEYMGMNDNNKYEHKEYTLRENMNIQPIIYPPPTLNLSKFMDGDFTTEEREYIYELYAVMNHSGVSNLAGHETAFCKNPFSGQWYKYNDTMRVKVDEATALNPNGILFFYVSQDLKDIDTGIHVQKPKFMMGTDLIHTEDIYIHTTNDIDNKNIDTTPETDRHIQKSYINTTKDTDFQGYRDILDINIGKIETRNTIEGKTDIKEEEDMSEKGGFDTNEEIYRNRNIVAKNHNTENIQEDTDENSSYLIENIKEETDIPNENNSTKIIRNFEMEVKENRLSNATSTFYKDQPSIESDTASKWQSKKKISETDVLEEEYVTSKLDEKLYNREKIKHTKNNRESVQNTQNIWTNNSDLINTINIFPIGQPSPSTEEPLYKNAKSETLQLSDKLEVDMEQSIDRHSQPLEPKKEIIKEYIYTDKEVFEASNEGNIGYAENIKNYDNIHNIPKAAEKLPSAEIKLNGEIIIQTMGIIEPCRKELIVEVKNRTLKYAKSLNIQASDIFANISNSIDIGLNSKINNNNYNTNNIYIYIYS